MNEVVNEMDGTHEDGIGYNQHGVFCGECGRESCIGCPQNNNKEANY